MPSRRHELIASVLPRLRKARDIDDVPRERARLESWHRGLDRSLPTRVVPGFARAWSHTIEDVGFPVHVLAPRRGEATRTLLYVHGGGYVAPIDPFHVRYSTRLAAAIGARVVLPDYPLAPEHTWRDSFDALVDLADRWSGAGPTVLAGDSAGGGYALALALALRDRGLALPTHLLLHAPWADLTTSTPDTAEFDAIDPWLFLSKLDAYADFWAGSPADLGRPEVSPALADLGVGPTGRSLPPGLMFYGTRDLLAPGCRLLARRAAEAGWDLTAVEGPDLIHVYPLLPTVPEARRAFRRTLEFLG